MVKSYSKNANHNMRRPIVNKDIVDYMRTHLKESTGHLAELEVFARKENIPIIQHEVVAYFRFLLQTLQPKKILEVGTAIGFFSPSYGLNMHLMLRLRQLIVMKK